MYRVGRGAMAVCLNCFCLHVIVIRIHWEKAV